MDIKLKKFNKKYKYDFDFSYIYKFNGIFDSEAEFESYVSLNSLDNLSWSYIRYDSINNPDKRKVGLFLGGTSFVYFSKDDGSYSLFETLDEYIASTGTTTRTNGEKADILTQVYGNKYKYKFINKHINIYNSDESIFEEFDIFRVTNIYTSLSLYQAENADELKVSGTYAIINPDGLDGFKNNPENNEYYVYISDSNGVRYVDINDIQYEDIKNIPVPISCEDKLDEALDQATFKIEHTTDRNRVVKGDVISLFVDDEEKKTYFAEQDNIVPDNVYDNNAPVTHNVALNEYTKITQGDILSTHTYSFYRDLTADVITVDPATDERVVRTAQEFIDRITDNPFATVIVFPTSGDELDFTGITYNPLIFKGRLIGYKRDSSGRVNNTGVYNLSNITINVDFYGSNKTSGTHELPIPIIRTDILNSYPINDIEAVGIFSLVDKASITGIGIKNLSISTSSRLELEKNNKKTGYVVSGLTGLSYLSTFKDIIIDTESISLEYSYGGSLFNEREFATYLSSFIGLSYYDDIQKINVVDINNKLDTSVAAIALSNIMEQSLCGFINYCYSPQALKNCSINYRQQYSTLTYIQDVGIRDKSIYSDFIGEGSSINITNCYSAIESSITRTVYSLPSTEPKMYISDSLFNQEYIQSNGSITNYYSNFNRTISATNVSQETNGEEKTLAELRTQSTYDGFDFTNIWNAPTGTTDLDMITPTIITDDNNALKVFEGTYTLREIIQRGIDIVETRLNRKLDNGTRLTQKTKYTISPNVPDIEINIIAPELFLNTLTFFEFLLTIGNIKNALPIISKDNEIDFYFLNREQIPYDEKSYSSQSISQNGQQYCSELISYNENMVNNVKDSNDELALTKFKVFPSIDSWITPRSDVSDDYRITNDTAILQMPEGIENIFKVEMRALDSSSAYQVVDITNNIVSKEQYGLLKNTETEKGRVLIFDQYKKLIYGFSDQPIRGFYPAYPAMKNILEEKNLDSSQDFKNLQFRIYYNPIYNNVDSAVRVEEDNDFINQFKVLINQGNNVISSEKLASNKQAKINKMGNIDLQRAYIVRDYSDIPSIGDSIEYDGKRYYANIITYEIYPTFIRLDVAYTKDFNKLNEFIDINRETRALELPTSRIKNRYSYLNEYLMFSKTQYNVGQENGSNYDFVGDSGHTTLYGLQNILAPILRDSTTDVYSSDGDKQTDCNSASNLFVDSASYYNKTTQQDILIHNPLVMSTIKFPISKGFGVGFGFNTNVSAGLSAYKTALIDTETVSLSEEVLYTRNGFMDCLSNLSFMETYDTTIADDIDVSKYLPYRDDTKITANNKLIDLVDDRINIFKDSREILNFALLNQFITDSDIEMVIADRYIELLPIINGQVYLNQKTKYYASYYNIEQYETKFNVNNGVKFSETAGYQSENIIKTSSPLEYMDNIIKIIPRSGYDETLETAPTGLTYKSLVITDSNDNILIAINNAFGSDGLEEVSANDMPTLYLYSLNNDFRN